MKKILLFNLFLVVFYSASFGQRPIVPKKTLPDLKNNNWQSIGTLTVDTLLIGAVRDTNFTPRRAGGEVVWQHAGVDTTKWLWTGSKWVKSGGSAVASIITGGLITSVPGLGQTIPANISADSAIRFLYQQSQVPTAGLTYNSSQTLVTELMSSGADLPYILNWSAGRNIATQPLQTVRITSNNGQTYNENFSQPSQGGNTTGTQSVTIPRNVTTVFTNTVTTIDGKITTATFTASSSPKRYWGMVATQSPTDANIIAQSSELSASRVKSWTVTPTVNYYLFYAYPANEGNLTSLKVNTFESILAFTLTQRSFTNASGNQQVYNIYVANNSTTVTNNQVLDAQ